MPEEPLPAPGAFRPGPDVLPLVSDATPWSILRELALAGPLTVGQLTARIARPAAAISKHLAVLREGCLVLQRVTVATDRRAIPSEIDPRWRVAGDPTLLDFGSCVLRLTRTA